MKMSENFQFRAKLENDEVVVHFSNKDIEAMTSGTKSTFEKRRKLRPSATSTSQTRMSTSDLRGVGISAPTGFVHVSGYNRAFQRCGSVSEASTENIMSTPPPTQTSRDHSRSRKLSNIDPKFTSQSGLCSSSELETSRGSIRIQHLTAASTGNCSTIGRSASQNTAENGQSSRFPRLQSCAHFHYECTDIGPISIELLSEDDELKSLPATKNETHTSIRVFSVQVTSHGKTWIVRRSFENFEFLDKQAHQCIFDRKYSQLNPIPQEENVKCQNGQSHKDSVRQLLSNYLHRFSNLAGPVITCGPVLNWLELDNRGHRLIVTDDCAINTPAVAAAYAIKRYAKQANDEISFEVGDMISVIDMPPPEESIWWRGKRGFEVGFFPCECVEVIGDKVPQGLNLPMGASNRLRKNSMTGSDNEEENNSNSPTSDQQPTKPVLRKHGKLISFFRSFILSRPARGKLKKSGILKERVFGCDLSEHLLNTGQEVPKVLTHCAEFIEARGIIDGIYRLSGIASNIQKLRVAFDEDRVPNLYDDRAVLQDIHSVASLLKMYFRELPNPVCTYHLYEKFVEAAKAPENQRIVLMRDVVQQLPPPNYRTLEYLARHLYRVSLRGHDTGMTAKNVAIVWAPNLLRAKCLEVGGVAALQGVGVQAVVTEYLIRYCELIFSDKMPSYNSSSNPASIINEDAAKKLRPKSLAISTPTKLLTLEEARNKAQESVAQKYIEVGGGPKSLPQKYHTVIDLPGRRSIKQRKSPLGWKAIFKGKNSNAKKATDLISNDQNIVTDNDLRTTMPRALLRPVKSAESLVTSATVQRSQSERTASSKIEEKDQLCPLEPVSKAVSDYKDSPRLQPQTHSRSNSHDSYFEGQKMDSSLDLSEIQVNFDLEENEMKIFSEDEAMLTNSLDGSEDFSRSPLEEQPQKFKMSFREKFKKFTSPTQNRKELEFESSSEHSEDAEAKKTEPMTLRERIVCALSPESLRKNNAESSPKKKKAGFSPGTSPSNTSQLVKRSKIEDEPKKVETQPQALTLSPSINFIDASMTESFESSNKMTTSDIKVANERFSTASSNLGETEQILNQLVVAQVHHDPVLEKRTEILEPKEDKETDSLEDDVKTGPELNTESYSIAGATISENESFSLASTDEDMQNPTQSSSFEAAPTSVTSEVLEDPEKLPQLPTNHVIQYSPKSSSNWSPQPQNYLEASEKMEVDLPEVNHELSCPLFPRETTVMTTAEVQLDHAQNLNFAGAEASKDIKGDINNPPVTTPTSSKTPSPKPRNSVKMEVESTTSKKKPVPTPRKSVTMASEASEAVSRSASAMGNHKKISFACVTKKLSTYSLHAGNSASEDTSTIPEDAPLQRRNSIHNVPYVDVNDPQTRERMERYKEERRSMLRAKYKVEDYMTSDCKYRRKSTEAKSPVREDEGLFSEDEFRHKSNELKSPVREDGLIDEDVNVKERAALFGGSLKTKIHTSRPTDNGRKMSPGSPSKIRDMAAFFEQKN